MPVTKQIQLYEFNELPEETQNKVIENFRINDDFSFQGECVINECLEIAALIGFAGAKIYYSGFCSQGDGACIIGDYEYKKGSLKAVKEYAPHDIVLHSIINGLTALQKKNFYKLHAKIKHNFRYYHERSTSVDTFNGDNDATIETHDKLYEILVDFNRWIYSRLNQEWDFWNSEEFIKEEIKSNEYLFNSEGAIES